MAEAVSGEAGFLPPWSNRGGKCGQSHIAEFQGAKVDWLTVTWLPEPDEHVFASVHAFLLDRLGGKVAFHIKTTA